MYLIDKSKAEFASLPDTLEGEVLLEEVKDENGNSLGYITMEAGILKHYAMNKTDMEIEEAGLSKYQVTVDWVKTRKDITEKAPSL